MEQLFFNYNPTLKELADHTQKNNHELHKKVKESSSAKKTNSLKNLSQDFSKNKEFLDNINPDLLKEKSKKDSSKKDSQQEKKEEKNALDDELKKEKTDNLELQDELENSKEKFSKILALKIIEEEKSLKEETYEISSKEFINWEEDFIIIEPKKRIFLAEEIFNEVIQHFKNYEEYLNNLQS